MAIRRTLPSASRAAAMSDPAPVAPQLEGATPPASATEARSAGARAAKRGKPRLVWWALPVRPPALYPPAMLYDAGPTPSAPIGKWMRDGLQPYVHSWTYLTELDVWAAAPGGRLASGIDVGVPNLIDVEPAVYDPQMGGFGWSTVTLATSPDGGRHLAYQDTAGDVVRLDQLTAGASMGEVASRIQAAHLGYIAYCGRLTEMLPTDWRSGFRVGRLMLTDLGAWRLESAG